MIEQQHNPGLEQKETEFVLKIVGEGYAQCHETLRSDIVSPPYSRLYYMAEGPGEIETSLGGVNLEKGRMYLIPAGCDFSYCWKPGMKQLYFHINLVNPGVYDPLRELDRPLCKNVGTEHIAMLYGLYPSSDTTDMIYLKSLLLADIFGILKENRIGIKSTEYSPCVKNALEYIEENLSAALSVREVADKTFVSPDTLSRKFRRELKTSVGKYIDDLVLFRAEELLRSGDMPVSQISTLLGFYDQFYFSRRFKERFGAPPLQYRRLHSK